MTFTPLFLSLPAMNPPPITHALIIAAGNGSRLKRHEADITPKPLRLLLGMPILERIILSAKKAGITSVTVVVGYQGEQIEQFLKSKDWGISISAVYNPDWKKKNGVSALCARASIGNAPFALLMADHIFAPHALYECLEDGVRSGEVKLAVDQRIDEIDDLDDATKVAVEWESGKITSISKSLPTYNAIDTGMFCCSAAVFEVLEALMARQGDCSLSEAMQCFADQGKLTAWKFPKTLYWQDVDTKPAFKIAERKLLRACIKPTDGAISRTINRRISLPITRLLMKTGLSANSVTGLVTLVGVLSGVIAAQGGYWPFLIGAILFQWASILDGCDGEMSRLTMTSSKLGQWLDTASDNLTYIVFIIGLMVGLSRLDQSVNFPYIVTATVFGVGMLLFLMFFYLIRYTNSGSLVSIQKDLDNASAENSGGFAKVIVDKIGFMLKRDFFALLFLALAVLGKAEWILYTIMVGTNIAWIVLFNMRRRFFINEVETPVTSEPSLH